MKTVDHPVVLSLLAAAFVFQVIFLSALTLGWIK